MSTLYTFGDSRIPYRTESVHFWGAYELRVHVAECHTSLSRTAKLLFLQLTRIILSMKHFGVRSVRSLRLPKLLSAPPSEAVVGLVLVFAACKLLFARRLPKGSYVVPFWGSILESPITNPKRN